METDGAGTGIGRLNGYPDSNHAKNNYRQKVSKKAAVIVNLCNIKQELHVVTAMPLV